jgi:predicted nuclease with RNAse H fold
MWLGVDPGGSAAFGIALLDAAGIVRTKCVSCAEEALDWVSERPAGVGVDAPMWWSAGRSSDRLADQWIRRTYRIKSGTVQAANSLRGAALVQGALFVDGLRRRYQDIPVTEAHPKALLKVVGGWECFCRRYLVGVNFDNEHTRDAMIAAVAAREGFSGRWRRDLAQNRHPSEQDPATFWLAPINYYWPDDEPIQP